MANIVIPIVVGIITLLLGILIGYIIRKTVGEKAIGSAEQKAKNLILDAENRSETIRKEYILEAKEEAHKLAQTGDVDGQQEQQGADVQRFAEILEFAVIAQDHRRSGNKAKAVGNALDHNVPQDHLPVFIGDAGDHGNA